MSERPTQILIVEDNDSDILLMREAVHASLPNAELHVVHDGERAIQFLDAADLDENAPCPALVILDINLPKKQGAQVLRHMRASRTCANTLVLVATSSDSAQDRAEMGQLGANRYFRKPSDCDAFLKLGEIVKFMLEDAHDCSNTRDR